jgi:hypothetical protein
MSDYLKRESQGREEQMRKCLLNFTAPNVAEIELQSPEELQQWISGTERRKILIKENVYSMLDSTPIISLILKGADLLTENDSFYKLLGRGYEWHQDGSPLTALYKPLASNREVTTEFTVAPQSELELLYPEISWEHIPPQAIYVNKYNSTEYSKLTIFINVTFSETKSLFHRRGSSEVSDNDKELYAFIGKIDSQFFAGRKRFEYY